MPAPTAPPLAVKRVLRTRGCPPRRTSRGRRLFVDLREREILAQPVTLPLVTRQIDHLRVQVRFVQSVYFCRIVFALRSASAASVPTSALRRFQARRTCSLASGI